MNGTKARCRWFRVVVREPDSEPVITPSGRDLFFKTSAGLVKEDTDGAPDIYDARIGGGFPVAEAPVERCEGDACQGPLTNPAPLLVPGSAVQASGENASRRRRSSRREVQTGK